MTSSARLNVLLAHSQRQSRFAYGRTEWSEIVSRLLTPVLIQTYVAGSSGEAINLAESHSMHVVVVDFKLPSGQGSPSRAEGSAAMNLVRLLQRQPTAVGRSSPADCCPPDTDGALGRKVPVADGGNSDVRIGGGGSQNSSIGQPAQARPLFILLAPPDGELPRLMAEALRWNVYSVLPEPVNIDELLDTMARALRRFYDNRWPL